MLTTRAGGPLRSAEGPFIPTHEQEEVTMQNCDQTTLPNDLVFRGQRLRRLRRERGMSVHLLAHQAGLCARQIWRLEAGDRPNVRAITVAASRWRSTPAPITCWG